MAKKPGKILLAVIISCLTAVGQGDWDTPMNAGKAAMQKHQYAQAEASFREALAAAEKFPHGEDDARFSATLLFLAQACDAQSKRDEAEMFAKRAADAMEKSLKGYKPTKAEDQYFKSDVASGFFDKVGDIFAAHQKYAEAEMFYQRVIKIRAAAAEDNHDPQTNEDFFRFLVQVYEDAAGALAAADEKLGNLYFTEHKYPEAATVYEKSLKIRVSNEHTDKRVLAQTFTNLASCYAAQATYDKAEPLYQRALTLFEQANWNGKPETVRTMQLYALLLRKAGREEEAKAMLERAAATSRQPAPAAK